MLEPELELGRLQDLMPASGRMLCKLQHRPEQSTVIDAPLPFPWQRGARSIYLNLDLWNQLPEAQRDLLLLRIVSWNIAVRWFKVDLYRGLTVAGLLGTLVELSQADAIGFLVSGGLTGLAATQIWRSHRSTQVELEADEEAIATAQRRGYAKVEAARHLLAAIEAIARVEGRPALTFEELLRCQNLKAIAGVSSMGVPNPKRRNP